MDTTAFTGAYAKLNSAQRAAVDTIDGPVLVVAGPGTGKTQLLSMRVANILQRADVSPNNILCLTFTEDAAQNMRERLSTIIGATAYDVEIHTFHSFGASVIARYSEYFYQGIGTQPIDELATHQIFTDIFTALPRDNPLSSYFEGEYLFLKGAQQAIDNFKTAGLAPEEVRSIARDNLTFIAHNNSRVAESMAGFVRIDKSSPERFEKLLASLSVPSSSLDTTSERPEPRPLGALPEKFTAEAEILSGNPPSRPLSTHSEADQPEAGTLPQFVKSLSEIVHESLSAALALYQQSGKTTPLTEFKNAFMVKNASGEWQLKDSDASKKLLALADIYEQYLLKLREANLIDFNDMITRVVHALENFSELRLNLQEQYQYILVDEFQDTSLAQLRIITNLTNNPVFEGRPNVLAVGDDDQAIYSFQGAELSNILNYHQMYRDVQVITLTENYRSRQAVLDAAQFVISGSNERLATQLPGITKDIVAKNDTLPTAQLAHHQFAGANMQYQWVASQIKALIASGTSPSDIAVIAAKHGGLRSVVPFLHAENIPVRYDKRENILEVPAIAELIVMARLVTALTANDHTTANNLFPQVLSFPFWDLSTQQIWHLYLENYRKRSPWLQTALESKEPKIVPIAEFFVTLSMKAGVTPLENVLDWLIGNQALATQPVAGEQLSLVAPSFTSPFKQYYFSPSALRGSGSSAAEYLELLSHLHFLRDRLREFRVTEQLYIGDLVQYVSLLQSARIQLVDTTPHREQTEAVTLHTAHSSKGLEFGTVFIIDANHEIWNSSGNPMGKISMPTNLPIERRSGDEDERRRLLFVAMTRAKHQLVITGFKAEKRGNAPLKYLIGAGTPPDLTLQPHEAKTETVAEVTEQLTTSWQDRHVRGASQPELVNLLRPLLDSYRLSVTHLQRFLNVADGGPNQWFLQCLLHFPQATTPNMAFGNAVHATLESAQKGFKQSGERLPISQLLNDFDQVLHKSRLPDATEASLQEFGHKVLTSYLTERYQQFSPEEYFEFDLGSRQIVIDGARLTGKVDRITPLGDNQFRVTDFKTGKPMQSWQVSDPHRQIRLHHYKQQLTFYRLLLEESRAFGNNTHVSEAAIEFVQPNSDGELTVPLSFVPTDEDVAHLRQVIRGAWQQMQSGTLPDVSQYPPNLQGIRAFEQDLATQ